MRKLLFILGILILGASCSKLDDCTNASGDRVLTQKAVTPFNTINLKISATVEVEVDTSISYPVINVIAQSNLHEIIEVVTVDSVLSIDFTECIDQHEGIIIQVRNPKIDAVVISGPGIIKTTEVIRQPNFIVYGSASGDCDILLDVENLSVQSNGSGELTFSGYAQNSYIDINTSGDFYGYELYTDTVNLFINSTGNSQVRLGDVLNAEINSSGDVYYIGDNPIINRSGTGSGKIIESN